MRRDFSYEQLLSGKRVQSEEETNSGVDWMLLAGGKMQGEDRHARRKAEEGRRWLA